MPLTTDERQIGGLAAVRALVEAGGSSEQVKAFIDTLDTPDDDNDASNAPEDVAAERRGRLVRLPTGHEVLLQESGGYTLAGNFPPEVRRAVAAYLKDHPLEIEEPVLVQEMTVDCLPIPGGGARRSTEEQLIDMLKPKAPQGGLSPAAALALDRSQGSAARTIGGFPIPEDSLSLEEARNAAIIGRVARPVRFSGETTIDGFPVPA